VTIETAISIVALVLVLGVIVYILLNARRGQSAIKQRLPLVTMLDAVKEEMLLADRKAKEQGSARLKFKECEFEFAIETEIDAAGEVTVWAVQLGAGAKQTESNTIRVKYVSLPDQIIEGAVTSRN
jgi:hypothetical protein